MRRRSGFGRARGSLARGLGGAVALVVAIVVFPVVMTGPVLSNPVTADAGHPGAGGGGATGAPPVLAPGFQRGRESGLPVPRFVSLKPKKARMRVGPSTDYATRWIYTAPGLPVEITEEYGHWRRVRDDDGVSGWMYGALLSGNRTGVIGPWMKGTVPLRTDASASAGMVAKLEARVRLSIRSCDGTWCHVALQTHDLAGYVRQGDIWGVYPNEIVK